MNGGQQFDLRVYVLSGLVLVAYATGFLSLMSRSTLMGHYFGTQDLPVSMVLLVLFALCAVIPFSTRIQITASSRWQVWLGAFLLVLFLWWGTHALMLNYPLTRDEHMVVFDAAIFGQLKLYARLEAQWQPFATALVPAFLLDVPDHTFLVSAYGPGNAMLRAAFGSLLDPALMNPVLAGAGLIALNHIARRLFPKNDGAVAVALLGYVLSAQVLVNAMTTYAMTPHLVLNLIWLALFLEDRRWTHALAILIGAWAIGLHQIIFHPLFAGPLILTLLARGRWGMFAAYAAVYAGAVVFWAGYPTLLMRLADVQASSGSGAGLSGFVSSRVLPLLRDNHVVGLIFMIYNLSRFVAWAPAFMLPLAAASWPAIRDNQGMALPLFAGVALTFVMMMVLLPYQGHGWGYRYLHPVLGNIMLLGGYGYARLAAANISRTNGFVVACSATTLILILPFLLYTTHKFVSPYATLTELVKRQSTDFVVIDTEAPSAAIDIVRNRPDLSNRPLVFSSKDLTQAGLLELCRRGRIAFITRKDFHRAGFVPNLPESSPSFAWRRRTLSGHPCVASVAE